MAINVMIYTYIEHSDDAQYIGVSSRVVLLPCLVVILSNIYEYLIR